MPVYLLKCPKCNRQAEEYMGINAPNPVCCGESMVKVFCPVAIRMTENHIPLHSPGYKRDYSKEYRESIGLAPVE